MNESGAGPAVNAVEEIIACWRHVLGIDEIGADDDFFELGGNSISAIRMLPLLDERFGVDIDVTAIFDNPTPAALAAAAGLAAAS